MIKILKRVSEYTLDDFKKYCEQNGVDFEYFKYYLRLWAIEQHEIDLQRFIRLVGPQTIITVSGVIYLDQVHYKLKDKTLSLAEAFEKMLTPDLQDFCVVLSPTSKYYVVYITHERGHNIFKFSLNDKN